jgi:hypothetical protein
VLQRCGRWLPSALAGANVVRCAIKEIKVDVLGKSRGMAACGFDLKETKELFAIRKRGSLSEAVLIPGYFVGEKLE